MQYRCVASSPEGLVQQVAVCYLRHGYWWYVIGRIPKDKEPAAVDRKLIEKYDIALTDRQRADRKHRGLANMQYIRYLDWFLLLTTEGHHPFKQQERNQVRDCRRYPIKFEGYSISYRRSGLTPPGGGKPKWHARDCWIGLLRNFALPFSLNSPARRPTVVRECAEENRSVRGAR